MSLQATKALAVSVFLVFGTIFLYYLIQTRNTKDIQVKNCRQAEVPGLKALSGMIQHSWFPSDYYDLNVYNDGPCLFYRFYQKPGTLYFGQDRSSGYVIGVAMSAEELHVFADTISPNTDFGKMLEYLSERKKKNPGPIHEYKADY